MDRTSDGVGAGPGENDIAALAGRDVAGVGLEIGRIDEGVMDVGLVIGEMDHAAFADRQPRRRKRPVGLTHLELGAKGGAGCKAED